MNLKIPRVGFHISPFRASQGLKHSNHSLISFMRNVIFWFQPLVKKLSTKATLIRFKLKYEFKMLVKKV